MRKIARVTYASSFTKARKTIASEMVYKHVLEPLPLIFCLGRFASPSIVHPYLLLLKSYSKNTPHTNHCIARMLHRVAVDLKMDALLFQLSVFHLFNKILSDPAAAAYKVVMTGEKS